MADKPTLEQQIKVVEATLAYAQKGLVKPGTVEALRAAAETLRQIEHCQQRIAPQSAKSCPICGADHD